MEDRTALVDRYIAIWNETDAEQRQELIAQTWTESAHYLDPLMQGNGHAGIDGLVRGVQTQFPGFQFRLVSAVDGHHDQLRFVWELGPEGVDAPIVGTDFATVATDGRLQTVIGFLDRVPAASA